MPILGTIASAYNESGTRGLFGGGNDSGGNPVDTMQYITIETTGNTTDFGDLSLSRSALGSCSSSTRGVFAGGANYQTGSYPNWARVNIDYVTIATTGNATNFGNLSNTRYKLSGCGSSTRGVFAAGSPTLDDALLNTIEYITIASTGNATNFGNLNNSTSGIAACSSPTRGVFAGGNSPGASFGSPGINVIDYVTIASTGNATDFGDLTVARRLAAGGSSSTRGVFVGGVSNMEINVIDYVTIASTGNATDFGDLTSTTARWQLGMCSSSIRGVVAGGEGTGSVNKMEYITIATTGNATEFGTMNPYVKQLAGLSSGHGGL